jgi:hypothetical protein
MPGFALEASTIAAKSRVLRSAPSITTTLHNFNRSGDSVRIVIRGSVNTTYAIETSPDLTNWTLIDYVINNSGVIEFTDIAPSGERRFYRARVIVP